MIGLPSRSIVYAPICWVIPPASPLTTLVFIYLVRNPELISFRLKIPIKVSMDIYIWHRLVYVILFGVIGLNIFSSFEAIVTFIVVIFIAIIVRIKLTPVKR